MSWKLGENGRVVIELSYEEYECLLLMMGYALGGNSTNPYWWRVVNAINEGNPRWTPYEIPEASEGERGKVTGNERTS
jgi:hypothetical protein